jgi:hypothetical protein
VAGRPGAVDVAVRFRLVEGALQNVTAAVELEIEEWSQANYVCMPGAVYNGNRYESRRMKYPPLLNGPDDIGPNVPTIISDIPRLNVHAGPSRIQQVTRDLSTPAAGYYSPGSRTACWLLTTPATDWGDSGIDIEENEERSRALLSVTAPYLRQRTMYRICDNQAPSKDRGRDCITGILGARQHSRHFELPDHLFDERSQNRCVGSMVFAPKNPFAMLNSQLHAQSDLGPMLVLKACTSASVNSLGEVTSRGGPIRNWLQTAVPEPDGRMQWSGDRAFAAHFHTQMRIARATMDGCLSSIFGGL